MENNAAEFWKNKDAEYVIVLMPNFKFIRIYQKIFINPYCALYLR